MIAILIGFHRLLVQWDLIDDQMYQIKIYGNHAKGALIKYLAKSLIILLIIVLYLRRLNVCSQLNRIWIVQSD